MRSRRMRLLRWLAVWLSLIAVLGFVLGALVGPIAPPHFAWGGAFVLASALTFLFVPTPLEDE